MTVKIRVLGPGCYRCQALYENTLMAVDELGLDAEVVKVEDITEMLARRIIGSPALVVDEKLVMEGNVPTPHTLAEFLSELLSRRAGP
ncbi:MAG TPA: thioredoxin family protein [Actinomycetota bacterium]